MADAPECTCGVLTGIQRGCPVHDPRKWLDLDALEKQHPRPAPEPTAPRERGTVKWFSETRGVGFIERENGPDVFVHSSAIETEGFQTLTEGDEVEFNVGLGLQGPYVTNVRVFNTASGWRPEPTAPEGEGNFVTAVRMGGEDAVWIPQSHLDDLLAAARRAERLEKEVGLRKRAADRLPFCPDHRDKVAGKPCRECRIGRLEGALAQVRDSMQNTASHVCAMRGCPADESEPHADWCPATIASRALENATPKGAPE